MDLAKFTLAAALVAAAPAPTTPPELTVLFFTAPWCGPCRAVHSTLDRIAGGHAGRVKLITVDFDSATDEVHRWEVHEIPAVIVIARDGKVMMRAQGGDPETLRGIESGLENLLKLQRKGSHPQ